MDEDAPAHLRKERSEMDALADAFSRKQRGGPRYGTVERVSVPLQPARMPAPRSGGPPADHPSRSHEHHQKYVDQQNAALDAMDEMARAGERRGGRFGGGGGREGPSSRAGGGGGYSRGSMGSGIVSRGGARGYSAASSRAGGGGGVDRSFLASALATGVGAAPSLVASLDDNWKRGPVDPRGKPLDLSDRPLLCSSTDAARGEVVVGGSDHALYVIDAATGQRRRTLYSKRYGHEEWVTAVTHLADGRVVSGAMDAKLCLWESSGVACQDLRGHVGTVSDVQVCGGVIVSTGYDRTVRLWSASTGTELSVLKGHSGPVLKAVCGDNLAVSCGRDGVACAWDLEKGSRLGSMKGHKGHVTSAAWLGRPDTGAGLGASVFATGAQDGHVRVWDLRGKRALANELVHVRPEGVGAVNGLVMTPGGGGTAGALVSAGADAAVCVLDPRKGFGVRSRLEQHNDFIYSLEAAGDLAFSGAGDGALVCHDCRLDRPLWALGANKAAVRCVGVTPNRLVAAGDDGHALVYRFD